MNTDENKTMKYFSVFFAASIAFIICLFIFWPKASSYHAQLAAFSSTLFIFAYFVSSRSSKNREK